ncbi:MAG: LCP family protein [Propionibacteriaceae bacterium]|nr:LCP family protein [Propionibacteriaceae bacterium]
MDPAPDAGARRATPAGTPPSWDQPDAGVVRASRPRRAIGRAAGGIGFGAALGWTVGGTVLPGLGLIRARHWIAGSIALALALAGLGVGVYYGLHPRAALSYLASPDFLRAAAMVCVVLGFAWSALAITTYWSLAPRGLTRPQRAAAGVVVAALTMAIMGPLAVAARYAVSQASLVNAVFADGDDPVSVTAPTFSPGTATDPWANTERVNLLFLGYDRGIGRDDDEGGLTDTIMVASIDTKTGHTVITSLPRNTARMPFPPGSPLAKEFPYGWYNGYDPDDLEWMLNTMYRNLPVLVDPDIIGPTPNLGADALKLSVGQALGLRIDYYFLVNIDGATDLIEAIGGITVNINKRIPVDGGGWLEPGPDQWLNGWDALQYARSRNADDDFSRMTRQRCVVNAIVKQANFTTMLTRYEAVAAAGSNLMNTDVPATMLPAMLELALRVKNGTLTSMQFGGWGDWEFNSSHPDFAMMRQRMKDAIAASTAPPADPGPSDPSAPDPTDPTQDPGRPSADPGDEPPSAADPADLDDVCAYRPE